jgi:hypothetical protein
MALIVVMPIPFGNVLAALALMLIVLGLVFRDGVAVGVALRHRNDWSCVGPATAIGRVLPTNLNR